MSRRASLYSKENPEKKKPKVHFPDELVFLDNIKENDVPAMHSMLRRVSVQIDINAIGNSGMTPLHQAVMENNLAAVQLLVRTGADINKQDEDTWTPLHAACANGYSDIAGFLLQSGADRTILTDEGERAYDLIEPNDIATVGVMLSNCIMREDESEEEGSDIEGCHSEDNDNENEDNEEQEDNDIENMEANDSEKEEDNDRDNVEDNDSENVDDNDRDNVEDNNSENADICSEDEECEINSKFKDSTECLHKLNYCSDKFKDSKNTKECVYSRQMGDG